MSQFDEEFDEDIERAKTLELDPMDPLLTAHQERTAERRRMGYADPARTPPRYLKYMGDPNDLYEDES